VGEASLEKPAIPDMPSNNPFYRSVGCGFDNAGQGEGMPIELHGLRARLPCGNDFRILPTASTA